MKSPGLPNPANFPPPFLPGWGGSSGQVSNGKSMAKKKKQQIPKPPKISNNQQRFINAFDGNGTQAAKKAGYSFVTAPPKTGFYVYGLIDSCNDELFYIGKGVKDRMFGHVKEWQIGVGINPAKIDRIRKIHQANGIVKYLIFHQTKIESEAFEIEKLFIKKIGRKNLTNIKGGIVSQDEKDRIKAINLLTRLKPDDGTHSEKYLSLRNFLIETVRSFGGIVDESGKYIKVYDGQATQVRRLLRWGYKKISKGSGNLLRLRKRATCQNMLCLRFGSPQKEK